MSGVEVLELARRLYRGLEMQAGIMRDPRRTGGWAGADNVANAFDRQAARAKELHDALATPEPALTHPEMYDMANGEVANWLRAIEQFIRDHGGGGETTDDMQVEADAKKALGSLSRTLAQPITEQPSPVGEVHPDETDGADRARMICSYIDSGPARSRVYKLIRDELNALATPPSDDAARIKVLEEAHARLREALVSVTKVRVHSWENIWAGRNRCADIARAALGGKP